MPTSEIERTVIEGQPFILQGRADSPVSRQHFTTSETAISGVDFQATQGGGTLSSWTVRVNTFEDDLVEGDETFTLTSITNSDPDFILIIRVTIIDATPDFCSEFYLDFDRDGRQDRGELNAGQLAQAISELDQLTDQSEGSLIRVEAAIEAYQQELNDTSRAAFGDYLIALGAEEQAIKAAVKLVLKKTTDKTLDFAYDIAEAARDGIEFSQSGSGTDFIKLGASLVQTAGKIFGNIGVGMSLGETATTLTYLSQTRTLIDNLQSEQTQLLNRIEELNAETEQLRVCLDTQNTSQLRIAPTLSNSTLSPEPLTVEVGAQTVLDFSTVATSASALIESDSIVLGSGQNDDFFADVSVEDALIDGADGFDYLVVDQSAEAFRSTYDDGVALVASSEASFVTRDVERVTFNDSTLAFDVDGVAGQTYRLYEAAFDRDPDAEGLGFWIDNYDVGNVDLIQMAEFFMQSEEFTGLYGAEESLNDEAFLTLLYANVLDRTPDQAGFDFWSDAQANGVSRAEMLQYFSESVENYANVAGEISDGIWYG